MLPRYLLPFLLLLSLPALARHCETKVLRGISDGKATQWQSVEIGLRFPSEERLYRMFLEDHSKGMNPYASASVWLQFVCHGKSYYAPAFYMQEAAADESVNNYVPYPSEWPWRVRFAVPDTGTWDCFVLTGDSLPVAVPQPSGIRFSAAPGKEHGYLRVAADQRHLEFTDRTPFFAIGQNIAWAETEALHGFAGPPPLFVSGYSETYHSLANLGDNGGNYVRIIMSLWSTAIEWEEAGVYHQGHAAALDSMMRICEEKGLYVHLCLEMQTGYQSYDPKYNWSKNPYKRKLNLQSPLEVLTNDSAKLLFEQRYRYIIARWGYTPHLGVIELMSEMSNWAEFEDHQGVFAQWHSEMAHYIRETLHDTLHLMSSSFGKALIGNFYNLPEMQVTSFHHYTNNYNASQWRWRITNGRNLYYERKGMLRRYDKPFIFGELGMTNGSGNNCDADDWESCSDLSFHNALWSTAFMGSFGTGLNWWQWKNDSYREAGMKPLRWFVDSVANGMRDYTEPEMWTGNGLEVFSLSTQSGASAVGWVHNTSWWWGNLPDSTCHDRSGKTMPLPSNNDAAARPENRIGNRFRIAGLKPLKRYVVTFYSTREKSQVISRKTFKTNALGEARLEMPAEQDCAFGIGAWYPGYF